MSTFQTTFLSEILEGEPIPEGKLAYFRSRLKNRLYELVLIKFKEKNINKAELARRLNKKPEQITRWLSGPGNWTIETLSDLLLAMGCEPELAVLDIVKQPTAAPELATAIQNQHMSTAMKNSDVISGETRVRAPTISPDKPTGHSGYRRNVRTPVSRLSKPVASSNVRVGESKQTGYGVSSYGY